MELTRAEASSLLPPKTLSITCHHGKKKLSFLVFLLFKFRASDQQEGPVPPPTADVLLTYCLGSQHFSPTQGLLQQAHM